MKKILLALLMFTSIHAYAERCISGRVMESRPTGSGYPGQDEVEPQESFSYYWDESSVTLRGQVNTSYGMFLYVSGMGDWIRGRDWSYCPETNRIVFHRSPVLTRYYMRNVYDGYRVWISYASRQR